MTTVAIVVDVIALCVGIGVASLLWVRLSGVQSDLRKANQRLDNADRTVQTLATQLIGLHQAFGDRPTASASAPAGLLPNESAPDFTLPDLQGERRTLSDFAGQSFVAIFFDTACGFCKRMAPRLGRLPESSARILIIGRGDREAYARLSAELGWSCDIVIDNTGDIMRAYRATGTPSGYRIDETGRIASALAAGEDQLFALIASPPIRSGPTSILQPAEAIVARSNGYNHNSPLTNDQRQPQPGGGGAGNRAPAFELDDLAGDRRSSSEWNNHKFILVFVEAGWPAHEELVTVLARNNRGLPTILVVEDGNDIERMRMGTLASSLTVLVDEHWRVARLYDVSATPSAVIVDHGMRLGSKVTMGSDPIQHMQQQGPLS